MGRTDYELIVFSDDWNGLPFSCKHLIKPFLDEVDVTWVETIGLRAPKLTLYDIKRTLQKLSDWVRPGKTAHAVELPPRLRIVNPVQIPLQQFRLARFLNHLLMKRALGATLRRRGESKKKLVTITTWPFLGNVVGALGEDLCVYMRVDDFSEFPGVNREVMARLEKELVEAVDFVLATSTSLMDVSVPGKDVRYLPHGVDQEHFSVAAQSRAASPLDRLAQPRIGFFGLLSDWIDLALIARMAALRPAWSFVLLGPSQLHDEPMPVADNIHALGPVPYDDLPAQAARFDVALIPFKINKLTQAVNPLKLMEYLSLGLPVVSTPLPELVKFKDILSIASTPEEFVGAVERILAKDSKEDRERRVALAAQNSWKSRSLQLRGWIEEALP